jgi:hypothetical protein
VSIDFGKFAVPIGTNGFRIAPLTELWPHKFIAAPIKLQDGSCDGLTHIAQIA